MLERVRGKTQHDNDFEAERHELGKEQQACEQSEGAGREPAWSWRVNRGHVTGFNNRLRGGRWERSQKKMSCLNVTIKELYGSHVRMCSEILRLSMLMTTVGVESLGTPGKINR